MVDFTSDERLRIAVPILRFFFRWADLFLKKSSGAAMQVIEMVMQIRLSNPNPGTPASTTGIALAIYGPRDHPRKLSLAFF